MMHDNDGDDDDNDNDYDNKADDNNKGTVEHGGFIEGR